MPVEGHLERETALACEPPQLVLERLPSRGDLGDHLPLPPVVLLALERTRYLASRSVHELVHGGGEVASLAGRQAQSPSAGRGRAKS